MLSRKASNKLRAQRASIAALSVFNTLLGGPWHHGCHARVGSGLIASGEEPTPIVTKSLTIKPVLAEAIHLPRFAQEAASAAVLGATTFVVGHRRVSRITGASCYG